MTTPIAELVLLLLANGLAPDVVARAVDLAQRHAGSPAPATTRAPNPTLFDDWPDNYQQVFWQNYPHKVGKVAALASLDRVRRHGTAWPDLLAGLMRYAVKTDDRPWCNPATWLNQGRWSDQPAPPVTSPANGGFAGLLVEHRRLVKEEHNDNSATEPEIWPPDSDPAPRR